MENYYIDLFRALQQLTVNEKLNWVNEPDTNLAFSCQTFDGKSKIVIDTYTAIQNDDETPCFNMSAFDNTGRLQTEIVLCDTSKENEEYKLMKDLYYKVKELSYNKMIETSKPIVSMLAKSFQEMTH